MVVIMEKAGRSGEAGNLILRDRVEGTEEVTRSLWVGGPGDSGDATIKTIWTFTSRPDPKEYMFSNVVQISNLTKITVIVSLNGGNSTSL